MITPSQLFENGSDPEYVEAVEHGHTPRLQYQIDSRYHFTFKRLRNKFSLRTIERHWNRIATIVERRYR